MTLSWFKGREMLNQTSDSEHSAELTLPLEVNEDEHDVYSCVTTNPVTNRTTTLNINQICPHDTGDTGFCGLAEFLQYLHQSYICMETTHVLLCALWKMGRIFNIEVFALDSHTCLQHKYEVSYMLKRAPVSAPIIRRNERHTRESCSPLCSVENGKDVNLSWYEGEERISTISSPNSSEPLYLPLNITHPNSSYTCVAANPVSNQTTQLNFTELCYKAVIATVVLAVWYCIKRTRQQGLLCVAGEEVIRLQELKGNTVTIHTGETGVQIDAQILWFYGPESAEVKIVDSLVFEGEIITDYDRDRFRDRLQLDRTSGSLTIRNISREDSGLYKLLINTKHPSVQRYRIDVYAPVSGPVINQTGKHSCSPLCSVENGKDVNLSWYEGEERISSITSTDSSERLYLPLNITHLNGSTYTCVAANPVSNQTTQINIVELCNIETVYLFIFSMHEMGLQSAFEDCERLRCSDSQWEFISPSGSQDREEYGRLSSMRLQGWQGLTLRHCHKVAPDSEIRAHNRTYQDWTNMKVAPEDAITKQLHKESSVRAPSEQAKGNRGKEKLPQFKWKKPREEPRLKMGTCAPWINTRKQDNYQAAHAHNTRIQLQRIKAMLGSGLLCVAGEEVSRLQELEGNTVTIRTGGTGVQSDAHILWFYRPEDVDITIVNSQIIGGEIITDYNRDRFGDRLQLDRTSGSLTIRNISREDSGVYKLHIITGSRSIQSYRINVYAPVSKTTILKENTGESCSLLCSVANGKDVNLSWYEGDERIPSISSTDSSERLILLLNITHLSCSYTYTCVAANPVSNQTTRIKITELCYKAGPESKWMTVFLIFVGVVVAVSGVALVVWCYKKETTRPQGLLYVAEEEVIRLLELEGNTVTIHTGRTRVQSDAHILWMYRFEDVDITIVNSQIIRGEIIMDYCSDRFRDRLQLDRNSGSLTIRNISREDSGVFELHIITGGLSVWSFSVNVYAPVSRPVINQTGKHSCSPLCSVENGKDVDLSWYEGEERISSITSTDSSERLYLPLNITHLNCPTYTCVAANPVSNQTAQINIVELCNIDTVHDHSDMNYSNEVQTSNEDQNSKEAGKYAHLYDKYPDSTCSAAEQVNEVPYVPVYKMQHPKSGEPVERMTQGLLSGSAHEVEILTGFRTDDPSILGHSHYQRATGPHGLLCVAGEEVIRLQELEGNTVTIHTGRTGVQSDAKILWFYGPESAEVKLVDSLVIRGEIITDYDRDRFRDRLQLDRTSGSLTIRNISREDSGVYKLQIITGRNSVWSFSVGVYAANPVSNQTAQLNINDVCYINTDDMDSDKSNSMATLVAVLISAGLIVAVCVCLWIWKKKKKQNVSEDPGLNYAEVKFQNAKKANKITRSNRARKHSPTGIRIAMSEHQSFKSDAGSYRKPLKGAQWSHVGELGLLCVAGEEGIRLLELEGNTVTIHTGIIGVQSDAHILWFYRSENEEIRIVNSLIIRGEIITEYYSDRFRDRLQLDRNSGSLTIRNMSREDSGFYKLQIITGTNSAWSFGVDVYAPVSTPVIRNQPKKRSLSHRESCFPMCSVKNGRDVILSWYEEKKRISNINSTDCSEDLNLPLEIINSNNSTYTCVAANPVSNHMAQLNVTELCYIDTGQSTGTHHLWFAVLIPVGLCFFALLLLVIWKKKTKQQGKKSVSRFCYMIISILASDAILAHYTILLCLFTPLVSQNAELTYAEVNITTHKVNGVGVTDQDQYDSVEYSAIRQ
ncbi:hypothetical protein NFI96_010643 [Prochilodus magdalenae]|nr:hypothetical protein NFI96_010643 [Prochilodus magdalenae]